MIAGDRWGSLGIAGDGRGWLGMVGDGWGWLGTGCKTCPDTSTAEVITVRDLLRPPVAVDSPNVAKLSSRISAISQRCLFRAAGFTPSVGRAWARQNVVSVSVNHHL